MVASIAPFAFSVRYAWTALSFPLELEIREGAVWLHALAKRAGVDIYDSSRVAFVNMFHGPMDSILKGFVAKSFPFLPASFVTRIFVFLLPFFLLGTSYAVCRKKWANAFLASAAIYLFLADFTPMLIVGRPDATALCGLAVCVTVSNSLLTSNRRSDKTYLRLQALLGSCSALVCFTQWRLVPAVALLQVIVLVRPIEGMRPDRFRRVLASCCAFAAGFVVIFALIFVFELHADWQAFYRRFFGAFTSESGVGIRGGPEFRLFVPEIVDGRWPFVAFIGVMTLLAVYRARGRPIELGVWIAGLAVVWVTTSYGYYRNQYAGGIHYFCPFFVVLWFFVLRSVFRMEPSSKMQLVATVVVILLLPWRGVEQRRQQVVAMGPSARTFLKQVEARAGGSRIVSEDMQLFKKNYANELVDMGDSASAIAKTGYYGQAFTATFRSHESWIASNPPRFVMAGCLGQSTTSKTVSPELRELLDQQYTIVLKGPPSFIAWGGGYAALFEKK